MFHLCIKICEKKLFHKPDEFLLNGMQRGRVIKTVLQYHVSGPFGVVTLRHEGLAVKIFLRDIAVRRVIKFYFQVLKKMNIPCVSGTCTTKLGWFSLRLELILIKLNNL